MSLMKSSRIRMSEYFLRLSFEKGRAVTNYVAATRAGRSSDGILESGKGGIVGVYIYGAEVVQ